MNTISCNRRLIMTASLAGAASLALPRMAFAETWPSKPLQWIVPFPAGGPSDAFVRAAAKELSVVLGQPIVVENISGAAGNIGYEKIAGAQPDGYTIGLATTGTHTINPSLRKMRYDPINDFTAFTLACRYANLLVVNAQTPFRNVEELVSYARQNPQKVSFGSAGIGSSNHLAGEVLKQVTGAPMLHVPYRGSGPALAALMSGEVTFLFDMPNTAMTAVTAGKARALAISTEKRWRFMPEIPTMEESGAKGFSEAGTDLWLGIVGPAKIAPEIRAKLGVALDKALRSQNMAQWAEARQFEIWASTPEQFVREIHVGLDRWSKIVKTAGVKAE